MTQESWPEWWDWDLELSPHLHKRMLDRGFTEADLRSMLEDASGHHADVVSGRWVIEASHERRPWEVIVEPDDSVECLVVITAYQVDTP